MTTATRPWHLVAFVFGLLRGEGGRVRRAIGICALMIPTAAAINATAPVALAWAVDSLQASTPGALVYLGLYALLLWLGKALSEMQWAIYSPVEQRMSRRLSQLMFRSVQNLPYSYHVRTKAGALSRIINRGAAAAQAVLLNGSYFVLPIGIELVLVCIILSASTSVLFGVVMGLCVMLYGWLVIRGTEELRQISKQTNAENTAAHGIAFDGITNFETVKYFGADRWLANRLDDRLAAAETSANRRQLRRAWLGVTQWSVLAGAAALLLMAAGIDVVRGNMTVGDIVLVNAYVLRLVRPLNNLGRIYRILRLALIDLEAVHALIRQAPGPDTDKGAQLPPGEGAITFEHVSFGYDTGPQVLRDVSFEIAARETVGIVGLSGSGKSTLTRLLFRFHDPSSGSIAMDGARFDTLSKVAVRQAISIVPQDCVLFNETLYNNLAMARAGATREDIAEAVALAQLTPLINRLPDGLESMVGERGKALSGGERQRVAIARAVLKKPRLLILDEATSALDAVTEEALLDALEALRGRMTMIVITHRPSTVARADRVLTLERGRMIETRPEALIAAPHMRALP